MVFARRSDWQSPNLAQLGNYSYVSTFAFACASEWRPHIGLRRHLARHLCCGRATPTRPASRHAEARVASPAMRRIARPWPSLRRADQQDQRRPRSDPPRESIWRNSHACAASASAALRQGDGGDKVVPSIPHAARRQPKPTGKRIIRPTGDLGGPHRDVPKLTDHDRQPTHCPFVSCRPLVRPSPILMYKQPCRQQQTPCKYALSR